MKPTTRDHAILPLNLATAPFDRYDNHSIGRFGAFFNVLLSRAIIQIEWLDKGDFGKKSFEINDLEKVWHV